MMINVTLMLELPEFCNILSACLLFISGDASNSNGTDDRWGKTELLHWCPLLRTSVVEVNENHKAYSVVWKAEKSKF